MADGRPTPDPLETTRRLSDAYNRRDVDSIVSMYSPSATWDMTALDLGVLEGHDAIRRFLEGWLGGYGEFEFSVEDVRDLGNGVAWAVALPRGRPRGGDGVVELRYGNCSISKDGLIERMTFSTDIDAGRAAGEQLARERETARSDGSV